MKSLSFQTATSKYHADNLKDVFVSLFYSIYVAKLFVILLHGIYLYSQIYIHKED